MTTTSTASTAASGFRERLAAGPLVAAEGYLFELERRGYLQAGAFVPQVVLDHPERVTALHEEFVHAGSDVVEAFTYYAHREKLRLIGAEHLLEPMNKQALTLASDVARARGALLAGNVCNTNVFDPADPASHDLVRDIFTEQVGWAAEAGADFIIAETISWAGEAQIALEVIQAAGLPSVVMLVPHKEPDMRDGGTVAEVCRRLADNGADVVGLNCSRGPATMLPLLEQVTAAVTDTPIAALPVPYHTTPEYPTMQSLRDPEAEAFLPEGRPFPTALDPFTASRYEIAAFTKAARLLGVSYLGVCCGAGPHHIRSMAEALGRTPPASAYSPDMTKHAYFGTAGTLKERNQQFTGKL